MLKEMNFSRTALNAYIKLMDGLSRCSSAIDKKEYFDCVERLNWDNKLVRWHHARVDLIGLIFPEDAACNIVEEAFGEKTSWEKISRQLEVDAARKRGVLELLRLAAKDSALRETCFYQYNETWEAVVVEHIINLKEVTRIRSRVQANFYKRSANRAHRMLAWMYLAKNDNLPTQIVHAAA